jgi:hypothetical protein
VVERFGSGAVWLEQVKHSTSEQEAVATWPIGQIQNLILPILEVNPGEQSELTLSGVQTLK